MLASRLYLIGCNAKNATERIDSEVTPEGLGARGGLEVASAGDHALKNIAKELEVPVIALSQLSRAVETRGGDKRPQLSDLRESGSIEQDADMVIFLYRPEYYGLTEDENGMPTQGICEVIIAKHRNGPTGLVELRFRKNLTRFEDLAPRQPEPEYG